MKMEVGQLIMFKITFTDTIFPPDNMTECLLLALKGNDNVG